MFGFLLPDLGMAIRGGSLTKAVAIDCEMVGVGSDGSKSALGRVTLVSTIFTSIFMFIYLLCVVTVCFVNGMKFATML